MCAKIKICDDLKVVGLHQGLQSDYSKFCSLLCDWGNRANGKYYKIKYWTIRENSAPEEKCVRNQPLVDKVKILLSPLFVKLGLMKNFVKAMEKQGKDFEYWREKFQIFRVAKLKGDIFIGSPDS